MNDIKKISKLIEVYSKYGFTQATSEEPGESLVFTLNSGYFNNADIVPLIHDVDCIASFNKFTKAGYACSVRRPLEPDEAEEELFKGFFSVTTIITRLLHEHDKFTSSLVLPFSTDAVYKYINAPYLINESAGMLSPAEEVLRRLDNDKPTLFLIEAAAGFGKTCTAHEIVRLIIENEKHLPLFSELSRHRQAVIFRHILLDEIDRTFPILSSRLVQSEIKNGRVITVLDGFDELLRKSEEGPDFENKEPMLETIGEFLTGHAKIVLTTRRTILFEGDAFYEWTENHSDDFDLVKIRISEPRIEDWLPDIRLSAIKSTQINIGDIANPVLLSYLRCIPEAKFLEVCDNPGALVEKYFDFMLEREKIRQDLRLSTSKQNLVLRSIAQDMINFSYTSEQRDYIVDHILRNNSKLLEEALLEYPATERPTREALANKLASHALLDKSRKEPNKIGFVNEFALGNYAADIILSAQDWLNDDMRFIEPAVISYQPRSTEAKMNLLAKLKETLEFVDTSDHIDISLRLSGRMPRAFSSDEANGLIITNAEIFEYPLNNFQFNECTFKQCIFNISGASNVTFLNCKFYNNTMVGDHALGPIYILGATGDPDFIDSLFSLTHQQQTENLEDRLQLAEKFILEKFWPIGRDTVAHKHRPIKGVCVNSGQFSKNELYEAISDLKKREILREPIQHSFVEINFDKIMEIREILNRD